MRAFYLLVRLRVLEVARSRSTAFFFLALPLVLLGALGAVFAKGHPFERRHIALAGSVATSSSARELRSVLAAYPEVSLDPVPSLDASLARLRSHMTELVIVEDARPAERRWRVISGPRGALFARGVVAVLPPGDTARIEVLPVSRWGYVHHLFPGLLAFATLVAGLYGMGYPMLKYRQNKLLEKLALTPFPRSSFIATQLVARTLLVLLQMSVMLAVAWLAFGLPLGAPQLAWLAVITTFGLLTFMALGVALACALRTDALMVDVISALTTPLVLLSEMFFPASELPGPLPTIAASLPTTQMVRLGRAVLFDGSTGLAALAPGLAILALWLVGSFAVSVLFFRWTDSG